MIKIENIHQWMMKMVESEAESHCPASYTQPWKGDNVEWTRHLMILAVQLTNKCFTIRRAWSFKPAAQFMVLCGVKTYLSYSWHLLDMLHNKSQWISTVHISSRR